MSKNFQPLEDRILILPIKKTEPETTEAGIITDPIKKATQEGIVIAVGIGRQAPENGAWIYNVLHKGDIVLVGTDFGLPINVPNENGGKDQCILMREGDVLIRISESQG